LATLTFIRPLLEYAGEVWVIVLSPTQNGLKKIQLEAARIVTGYLNAYDILPNKF
jgi:hypothetical protein